TTTRYRRAMPVDLAPLPQHGGNQPAGETLGPPGDGCVVHPGAEEVVRQADGAGHPVRAPPVSAQAPVPVELRRPVLQRCANVAEPQRAPGAVTEHVKTEETKVIRSEERRVGKEGRSRRSSDH